jgi:hypothetical protein
MLPDTGIDDVKKQRNAEYANHIHVNDPVLSSLKMEGIRLLFFEPCSLTNPDLRPSHIIPFWPLGTFVKLRKATISFVISVCLSVRHYGTTQISRTGFHVI